MASPAVPTANRLNGHFFLLPSSVVIGPSPIRAEHICSNRARVGRASPAWGPMARSAADHRAARTCAGGSIAMWALVTPARAEMGICREVSAGSSSSSLSSGVAGRSGMCWSLRPRWAAQSAQTSSRLTRAEERSSAASAMRAAGGRGAVEGGGRGGGALLDHARQDSSRTETRLCRLWTSLE